MEGAPELVLCQAFTSQTKHQAKLNGKVLDLSSSKSAAQYCGSQQTVEVV